MEKVARSKPTLLMSVGIIILLLILLRAKVSPRSLTPGTLIIYIKQRLTWLLLAILIILDTQVLKDGLDYIQINQLQITMGWY